MCSLFAFVWLPLSFLALVFFATPSAFARDVHPPRPGFSNETPKALEEVGITPNQGGKIDLDLEFRDHNGELVRLRDYTQAGKPILLSLAYYACPSLCNFHLNGLNDTLKRLEKPLGDEFNLVVVSFDPKEKPDLAKAKRESYIQAYGRPEGEKGWHFLTGDAAAIGSLTKSVGFEYRWDEEQQQYAHASAAIAISPDGTISRYLYGITFDPKTLRLSMVEASQGKVGGLVEKLILYCFHFDPKENKYTVAAFNIMRAGAVLVVLVIAAFLLPFWIRSRRELGAEG